MKPWKANELNFYYVCLKQLAEKGTQIAILIGKLESLAGRLPQKFFRIDKGGSEKTRAAKRKQEIQQKPKMTKKAGSEAKGEHVRP